MKIYFLVPVYNEADNIPELANSLHSKLTEYTKFFVFVDDKSTDTTVDVIKQNFPESNLHIITKEQNAGPGDSFNVGFEWILSNSKDATDVVVTLEGDNTSDKNLLPTLVSISQLGFDMVLASPYAQGGGFSKTSFFRKAISFIANMFFRTFFNVKILTLSSFYRLYTVELIRQIKNSNPKIIAEKGFICMLEILLKAIALKARIIEVPMVLHSDVRKGKSKMKIVKTSLEYFKFFIRYRASK
ncbi:MAG: glycosyltransferase [Bacteroidetes bacterium]|nr:glycosyltransferase [Bacteroidota bacterium]